MKRECQGFTLIEMLTVIVVISVVAGMVHVVASKNPGREALQQAHHFLQLLQTTRESAVLEGREYGLRLESENYQLMRLEQSVWRPLGPIHQLPAGLFMSLEQEGQPLVLSEHPGHPQILMLSSDEFSPFTLRLSTRTQPWLSISGDGLGEPLINEN